MDGKIFQRVIPGISHEVVDTVWTVGPRASTVSPLVHLEEHPVIARWADTEYDTNDSDAELPAIISSGNTGANAL